jgi:branched-subunit amino acid aminotransferase/4-amino-4-deoxychorismate lyase
MHKYASFNQQILPAAKINLNPISSAGLYGKGVFTTLAVYHSKPFLWEKHLFRLNLHAEKIGLELSGFNKDQVTASLDEIIKKNNIKNGRCRLTFFDESSSKIWQSENRNKTSLLINTGDLQTIENDLSIYVSPYSVNSNSPLAGIKSCNYLENIMALEDAKRFGFDEAIRLNERNEVVSGCMANIFWSEYGKKELFTPSLKTGCLAGTTRELITEKVEVVEVEKEINELFRDAEQIFLTSSGIGIVQIADVNNGIKLNKNPHELPELIKKEIENL